MTSRCEAIKKPALHVGLINLDEAKLKVERPAGNKSIGASRNQGNSETLAANALGHYFQNYIICDRTQPENKPSCKNGLDAKIRSYLYESQAAEAR